MPARKTPPHLAAVRDGPKPPAAAPPAAAGIGTPPAPSHLPPAAQREWHRVVRAAADRTTWLQEPDRIALECYCLSYALYRQACDALANAGLVVPGRSSADQARDGMVKHPAIAIWRAASAELRGWIRELGFSPDARGRVDLGEREQRDARSQAMRRLLS